MRVDELSNIGLLLRAISCHQQGSSKSLKSVPSLKTLFMFQISLADSDLPVRTVAGEHGASHQTNGWVLACKSHEDALEWVRVFNAVSSHATLESFHSSLEPEVNITMKVGSTAISTSRHVHCSCLKLFTW
jgi:hypothetical protein